MPYIGEHSARINPPGKYSKLRRQNNKFGPGVHVIYGVLPEGGGSEVQSIHFDSDKFTPEEAKEWLKEHDYKTIEFEEALTEDQAREQARKSGQLRLLGIEIPKELEISQSNDGSLTVHHAPLLSAGIWTDSAVGTPLEYTPKALEKHASNWRDISNWSRHSGGTPRDITEKIGEVQNIAFEKDTVFGDVRYHGLNERSRDTIRMILAAREGKISMPYISVEHGGTEIYNKETRRMEADQIVFYGSATVNQGACRKCRLHELPEIMIPEPEVQEEARAFQAASEPIQESETMTETKELEAKIETLTKELAELKTAPKPPEVNPLEEVVRALEAKVKELEKQPAPPATVPVIEQSRELGEVETYVTFDRKNKIARRA